MKVEKIPEEAFNPLRITLNTREEIAGVLNALKEGAGENDTASGLYNILRRSLEEDTGPRIEEVDKDQKNNKQPEEKDESEITLEYIAVDGESGEWLRNSNLYCASYVLLSKAFYEKVCKVLEERCYEGGDITDEEILIAFGVLKK